MRTVLVLLFVVFIGFGFLLSDNLHVRQDFTDMQKRNAQLMQDIKNLQEKITTLQNENIRLNEQVGRLNTSNTALQEQVYNLQKENSTIRNQNSQLQSRIDRLTAISLWIDNLLLALSTPISLAIFVPFVPLSLGATYIWLRSRKMSDTSKNANVNPSRKITVQVTNKELRGLINARRKLE